MIEINLLPGAGRRRGPRRAGVGISLPAVRELVARVKDPWLIACVAAWALVAGLGGSTMLKKRALAAALDDSLASVQQQETTLKGFLDRRRAAEAKRDSLLAQIAVIERIDRDRYVWPHILDEIAKVLPPYTWLTDVAARQAEGDTSGTPSFLISGSTVDMQALTRFLRELEGSPFIEAVSLVSTGIVTEEGRDVTTFVTGARFQRPDSSAITLQPLAASLVQTERSGGPSGGSGGRGGPARRGR